MHYEARVVSFAILLSLAGCSKPPNPSNDAFQRAIRESHLQCETVLASEALNSAKTAWRVHCAEAATYMAMLQRDGSLCVEPMPIGDVRVGLPPNVARSACAQ